jgi:hypothetical protein
MRAATVLLVASPFRSSVHSRQKPWPQLCRSERVVGDSEVIRPPIITPGCRRSLKTEFSETTIRYRVKLPTTRLLGTSAVGLLGHFDLVKVTIDRSKEPRRYSPPRCRSRHTKQER